MAAMTSKFIYECVIQYYKNQWARHVPGPASTFRISSSIFLFFAQLPWGRFAKKTWLPDERFGRISRPGDHSFQPCWVSSIFVERCMLGLYTKDTYL